ncbi:MAG: sterol desaturase family protein [Lewinella sp.]
MSSFPTYLVIPILLLLVAMELWHERSHGNKTYTFRGALANLNAGMVEYAVGVGTHVLVVIAYVLQYEHISLIAWPSTVPGILVAFMLYEFCYYWKHRLGHEVNFMWAGHIVHHQSEEMNFTTGARLSSSSPLYDVVFYIPMALIGITPAVYVGCKAVSLGWQFFLHTEHIRKLPTWAEFILNTPSHHRVHHSCREEHLDKNYGSLIILWDRLFGTFADESLQPVYGTTEESASLNPITANVVYYGNLVSWVRRSRTWSDASRVLFGRPDDLPGYLPKASGGRPQRTQGPQADLRWYALAQFVGAIAVVFGLLKFGDELPIPVLIIGVGWVLWTASQVGNILERNIETILLSEVARHLATLLILLQFYFWQILPAGFLLLAAALYAISGAVLLWSYFYSMRLMV